MIRLVQPLFDQAELDAVSEVIRANWIAQGPRVRAFEEQFAASVGARHAIACQSGTAALSLALEAMGVAAGHEVVVPSLTFSASAATVVRQGSRVIWGEIASLDCPLLDETAWPADVTPATRAVMFVAYAGYIQRLVATRQACRQRGLKLIVDATHAPGLRPEGRPIGELCECAAYSFHSTKNMTCGEGGMLVTDDADLNAFARRLREHGLERFADPDEAGYDYRIAFPGWNARISDLTAAVGLAQLGKLERFNARRIELAKLYDRKLAPLGLADLPLGRPFAGVRDSGTSHVYPVLVPRGADRRAVRVFLRERGIETAVHYTPLHRQSCYDVHAKAASLPITDDYTAREISIPLHAALTEQEQDTVVQALADALEACGRQPAQAERTVP